MTVKLIKIQNNKIIYNKKGNILKFLNSKSKQFKGFGELYFSEIKKNTSKGWNIHYKYFSIITVPYGLVEFTFFNPKKKIKNFKKLQLAVKKIFLFKYPQEFGFVLNQKKKYLS